MSKEKSLIQLSSIATRLRKDIENISSYRDFPIIIYSEKGYCYVLEEISKTSISAYSWADYNDEDFSDITSLDFDILDKSSVVEIYKLIKQHLKK